jgi:tetratricopeptide (TPR) repeat protein
MEEKELKKISQEFNKALQVFHKKDFKTSLELLTEIMKNYRNSEYDSVLEIQTQSKVYRSLAESRLHPQKVSLKTDEDFLNEGLYNLNAGQLDQALKYFLDLSEKRKYSDPYIYYLISLTYIKQEDEENALQYLKKCISKDDYYKVIAHNEPDFESLSDNSDFLAIIE